MSKKHATWPQLRKGAPALLLLTLAAGLPLVSCATPRRPPAAMQQIDISDDPVLVLGREVFMSYCWQCHPGGSAGLGPGINDRPLPEFLIQLQVRNGIGAMPGFSEEIISDRELNAVAKYVQALQ